MLGFVNNNLQGNIRLFQHYIALLQYIEKNYFINCVFLPITIFSPHMLYLSANFSTN